MGMIRLRVWVWKQKLIPGGWLWFLCCVLFASCLRSLLSIYFLSSTLFSYSFYRSFSLLVFGSFGSSYYISSVSVIIIWYIRSSIPFIYFSFRPRQFFWLLFFNIRLGFFSFGAGFLGIFSFGAYHRLGKKKARTVSISPLHNLNRTWFHGPPRKALYSTDICICITLFIYVSAIGVAICFG